MSDPMLNQNATPPPLPSLLPSSNDGRLPVNGWSVAGRPGNSATGTAGDAGTESMWRHHGAAGAKGGDGLSVPHPGFENNFPSPREPAPFSAPVPIPLSRTRKVRVKGPPNPTARPPPGPPTVSSNSQIETFSTSPMDTTQTHNVPFFATPLDTTSRSLGNFAPSITSSREQRVPVRYGTSSSSMSAYFSSTDPPSYEDSDFNTSAPLERPNFALRMQSVQRGTLHSSSSTAPRLVSSPSHLSSRATTTRNLPTVVRAVELTAWGPSFDSGSSTPPPPPPVWSKYVTTNREKAAIAASRASGQSSSAPTRNQASEILEGLRQFLSDGSRAKSNSAVSVPVPPTPNAFQSAFPVPERTASVPLIPPPSQDLGAASTSTWTTPFEPLEDVSRATLTQLVAEDDGEVRTDPTVRRKGVSKAVKVASLQEGWSDGEKLGYLSLIYLLVHLRRRELSAKLQMYGWKEGFFPLPMDPTSSAQSLSFIAEDQTKNGDVASQESLGAASASSGRPQEQPEQPAAPPPPAPSEMPSTSSSRSSLAADPSLPPPRLPPPVASTNSHTTTCTSDRSPPKPMKRAPSLKLSAADRKARDVHRKALESYDAWAGLLVKKVVAWLGIEERDILLLPTLLDHQVRPEDLGAALLREARARLTRDSSSPPPNEMPEEPQVDLTEVKSLEPPVEVSESVFGRSPDVVSPLVAPEVAAPKKLTRAERAAMELLGIEVPPEPEPDISETEPNNEATPESVDLGGGGFSASVVQTGNATSPGGGDITEVSPEYVELGDANVTPVEMAKVADDCPQPLDTTTHDEFASAPPSYSREPTPSNAQESVPSDPATVLLSHLFLICIIDGLGYSARSRHLLRASARYLGFEDMNLSRLEVKLCEELSVLEEMGEVEWESDTKESETLPTISTDNVAKGKTLDLKADGSDPAAPAPTSLNVSAELLTARSQRNTNRRIAYTTLAAVGGGVAVGLTAVAVAPMIVAGITAIFGVVGISTGAASILAGTTGMAVIGGAGAVVGGGSLGQKMKRRIGAVDEFELVGVLPYQVVWLKKDLEEEQERKRKEREKREKEAKKKGHSRQASAVSNHPIEEDQNGDIDLASLVKKPKGKLTDDEFTARRPVLHSRTGSEISVAHTINSDRSNSLTAPQYIPAWRQQRHPSVTICVSGWLVEGESDFTKPWSLVQPGSLGEMYALQWDPTTLMNLGNAFTMLASEVISFGVSQLLNVTVLSILMNGLTLPQTVLKLGYLVDNPWGVALEKGKKAGLLLADALIARTQGGRPVTLIGSSIGGRVVFYCLLELAERGHFDLVEDVFIFGAPVMATRHEWEKCRLAASGRFVNGFYEDDWILGLVYRSASLIRLRNIAGLVPVLDVPLIENIDVSDIVSGHLEYRTRTPRILKQLGVPMWREWFDQDDEDEYQESLAEAAADLSPLSPDLSSIAEMSKVSHAHLHGIKGELEDARQKEVVERAKHAVIEGKGKESAIGADGLKSGVWNAEDIAELEALKNIDFEHWRPREIRSTLPTLVLPSLRRRGSVHRTSATGTALANLGVSVKSTSNEPPLDTITDADRRDVSTSGLFGQVLNDMVRDRFHVEGELDDAALDDGNRRPIVDPVTGKVTRERIVGIGPSAPSVSPGTAASKGAGSERKPSKLKRASARK